MHKFFDLPIISLLDLLFNSGLQECYNADDVEHLPKHCFIFTRLADGHEMTPCSRFGGVSTSL